MWIQSRWISNKYTFAKADWGIPEEPFVPLECRLFYRMFYRGTGGLTVLEFSLEVLLANCSSVALRLVCSYFPWSLFFLFFILALHRCRPKANQLCLTMPSKLLKLPKTAFSLTFPLYSTPLVCFIVSVSLALCSFWTIQIEVFNLNIIIRVFSCLLWLVNMI